MAKIVEKPYDFKNDNGEQITGVNYFVRIHTKELGEIDLKIVTKSETDKRLLENLAERD